MGNSTFIEILANTSIHDVLVRYEIPKDTVHLVLLNGIYIEPEERETPIFSEGDVWLYGHQWPGVRLCASKDNFLIY